jgi:hypothetical protein
MRPIVFISAPFGALMDSGRQWNTERAETLHLLAIRMGNTPICVHSGILRGAFGWDWIPEDRAAGVESVLRFLDLSDQVWALTEDNGGMSPGMTVEFNHWANNNSKALPWDRRTWDGWMPLFRAHGLGDKADLLRDRP